MSIDRRLGAVVIAVRGTLSIGDILVDLYLKEQTIEWQSGPETKTAVTHYGMYKIAETIFNELKENNVFSEMENRGLETFPVICTGHSLGAGVATLLAFLIRNDPTLSGSSYPRLPGHTLGVHERTVALGYATPGCIISAPGVSYFRTFTTSIVLGDDVVSRLSHRSIHDLRLCIVRELSVCDLRKISVLRQGMFQGVPTQPLPAPGPVEWAGKQWDSPDLCEMYIPGRVLHLHRPGEQDDDLCAVWSDAAYFGAGIRLTADMVLDHLPNRLGNALRAYAPIFDDV